MPSQDVWKAFPPAALTALACESAANGDISQMKALVEHRANVEMGTSYDCRTPLHLAAARGNLQMVKFLIEECGAAMGRDRFGLLPIHDAVENGHLEVRRYLQDKELRQLKEDPPRKRPRSESFESTSALSRNLANYPDLSVSLDHTMGNVFDLAVREGVFSHSAVHTEVQHVFKRLSLHPLYFEHFTPYQIAKHIHCLIAAKRVVQATGDMGRLYFDFGSETSRFFLSAINREGNLAHEAQRRAEEQVANYMTSLENQDGRLACSLIFMASEGPAFPGGDVQLGIWSCEQAVFHASKDSLKEEETSLDLLASARFVKEKTREAKEQYQRIIEDVIGTRNAVCRILPGSVYPGKSPGGYVLLFGTQDTIGRHFFPEICQALRFAGLSPKRSYFETFLNGIITYSMFFPTANEKDVQKLERAVLYSTLLQPGGKSNVIYESVMRASISHNVGLYLTAAVKFVYAFFPKEQYSREYTAVHKAVENEPAAQRKLEALYRMCMKELLSLERIYELALAAQHSELMLKLFDHFQKQALGQMSPAYSTELDELIDKICSDPQDRQILKMFLTFNESILQTNFFKAQTPAAFSFAINPLVVLKNRPTSLYPEKPFAIYMISGRDFSGFHVRFRDVARGGIRLVLSRDQAMYERNFATLFDECYNLAYTQQNKNKDIPEGGSKGIILPDISVSSAHQGTSLAKSCFTRYLHALLDCMMPKESNIYSGHMDRQEFMYFGPDENTAGFMDHGAELAKQRGYTYWKAITTGKSVKLGGMPHDVYGMTTCSVHTYVTELLRELGEKEENITKFQTGGPDGDLGSNEILVSKDKTIGIVDGSGVLYDPSGLNRPELRRLAKRRLPVKYFSRSFLGSSGFLVAVEETDVQLPDGSKWRTGAELRDKFHLTSYASADLFVPCGGRPNSVTTDNVMKLFQPDGKPKFRMVVEGANLFMTDGARIMLEKAGTHVFKDASTNKGGVTCSSLEVFAALALPSEDHKALLTYDPNHDDSPPEFYTRYVNEILHIITENAKLEFSAIWAANQQDDILKVNATHRLSAKINVMTDSIHKQFAQMSEVDRNQLMHSVLAKAVPPLMVERLGVSGILKNVPQNYVRSIVAAWIASRYVYQHGIGASEVSFFFFLNSLLGRTEKSDRALGGDTKRPLEAQETDNEATRQRLK